MAIVEELLNPLASSTPFTNKSTGIVVCIYSDSLSKVTNQIVLGKNVLIMFLLS